MAMLRRMLAFEPGEPDMPTNDDDRPVLMRDLRQTEQLLRSEMRALAAELRAEMHELFGRHTRTVLVGQFTSSVTLAALLIAAVKL